MSQKPENLTRCSSAGLYWPELGDLGESWSSYQKEVQKEKKEILNSHFSKSADGYRSVRRLKSMSIDCGSADKRRNKLGNPYDFSQIQLILKAHDMPQITTYHSDDRELVPIVEAAQFQKLDDKKKDEKQSWIQRSQSMRSTRIPVVQIGDSAKPTDRSAPQTSDQLMRASKGRSLSRFLTYTYTSAPRYHDKDWSHQIESSLGIDFKRDVLPKRAKSNH